MLWTPCDVSQFLTARQLMGVFPGPCPSHSAPKVDVPRMKDLRDHVGGELYRKVCFFVSSPELFLLLFRRAYPCRNAASQVQTDYRWISKGYYFLHSLRCNISVYGDQKHWWAAAWLELWLIDFLRKKKCFRSTLTECLIYFFFTEAKKGKEVIWGHTSKMLQEDKLRWFCVWVEDRKLWHCFQSENWKCFEICWLWFWFNDRQNLLGIAFFERTWSRHWFAGSLWTSENVGLGWYQVVWNRQCCLVLQRTAAHSKSAPRASGEWGHWSCFQSWWPGPAQGEPC